jgi:SAM-dependent methyltransferase
MQNMQDYKEYWESCKPLLAHRTLEGMAFNEEQLFRSWEKLWIEPCNIDFKGKSVVDFGCGGGFLGKYLLSKGEIAEYYAIDIAEESIKSAQSRLSEYENCVYSTEINNIPKGDILVCQAVIQHMPSIKETNKLINKFNKSKIDTLVLQLKYADNPEFNDNDFYNRVRLPSIELHRLLTNYESVYISHLYGKNNCYYLVYKLKQTKDEKYESENGDTTSDKINTEVEGWTESNRQVSPDSIEANSGTTTEF